MKPRPLFLSLLVLSTVSPVAHAQWIPDGVPVCNVTGQQENPRILPDGAGGALLAWEDARGVNARDIYVQRLNASGAAQWTANGVALSAVPQDQQELVMVPDGAGGAFVFWVDFRNSGILGSDIFFRRVNSAGVPQGVANGSPITGLLGAQNSPVAVADGAGGAIVTWRDFRNGNDYDVYAQRVNAAGAVQWTGGGVAVATQFEDQTIPEITSDGSGGAIIAWFDRRSSQYADVYAQRVNNAGVPQWADDGVAISAVDSIQRNPTLVPDGSGGAMIAWWDSRNGGDNYDIFAQRVSSTGVTQWTANGVPVCTAPNDQILPLTLNSGTGVLIAWSDFRSGVDYDLYGQRLNNQGTAFWAADGVEISGAAGDQLDLQIAPDGSEGLIATWTDDQGEGTGNVYAQRITSVAITPWSADGVLLCDVGLAQHVPVIASDGAGGAIVAWEDSRISDNDDIYAMRILSSGTLPVATPVAGRTPSLFAGDVYPNPMTGTAWMDIELESTAAVRVDVFDVAGRLVRADAGRRDGASRIMIDARDDAGRLLPSGVYFCRVQATGGTITRKLVIAR